LGQSVTALYFIQDEVWALDSKVTTRFKKRKKVTASDKVQGSAWQCGFKVHGSR
jgi:hypothetical protein